MVDGPRQPNTGPTRLTTTNRCGSAGIGDSPDEKKGRNVTFRHDATREFQRPHGRHPYLQNAHAAPPRTVPTHNAENGDDSWCWHVVDALITLCGGHTNGLGKTPRERVTTALWLLGATLAVLVIFIAMA